MNGKLFNREMKREPFCSNLLGIPQNRSPVNKEVYSG